jgi:CRISPR-associated protein Csm3
MIVRDVPLLPSSAEKLKAARTPMPYTEVKTEVSIDRVTSQANPRTMERVPAGAEFGPMELIISLYSPPDVDLLDLLLDGMTLLEDDYLGGHGSRGSGKIEFYKLRVHVKVGGGAYRSNDQAEQPVYDNLTALSQGLVEVRNTAQHLLFAD